MALVEVDDLVVRFPGQGGSFDAVAGISFRIAPGERVGMVGESGSGKSVTAQALLRLLPHPGEIATGSIRFDGHDVLARSQRELQRWRGAEISAVFQDPMSSLNPLLKVGSQLTEPLRQHLGLSQRQAKARAIDLLSRVGIADAEARMREYPAAFSGGMRQRVCIAVAASCSPKLIIADEPTTALDVTVQAQVLDLLDDMSDEIQTATLLISHDLGVVSNFCERIIVMYGGRIVETGTTEQIIGDPRHPYTQGLLASIPRLESDLPDRLPSIQGAPPLPGQRRPGCSFAPRCPLADAACQTHDPRLVPVNDDGRSVACGVVAPQAFDGVEAVTVPGGDR